MRPPGVRVLLAALLLSVPVTGSQAAPDQDRVWFCPGPGTIDFVRLFERPEEWTHARQLVSVFKFYQQHTQNPPPVIVGPNKYDSLARAGVFRTLKNWGKKTSIEVGAVKEGFCTPDASGMNAAVAATLESLRAVQAAGGAVTYLSMDEPFVSGRARVCGGPALEPTADRVATYVAAVSAAAPNIRIGLIEAYPFSSADAIERMVQLLKARNATPAFLHMDVDWHLSGAAAFKRDMPRLQAVCAAEKIPFGMIITGYDGNADALYAIDAYGITNLIAETFPTWDRAPDHLILQSWAVSGTGLLITPGNLPEDRPYTHTAMLWDVLRRLKGSLGSATGTAIIRR
jgi:hypothetical protein